jgi:hypothetical protein
VYSPVIDKKFKLGGSAAQNLKYEISDKYLHQTLKFQE